MSRIQTIAEIEAEMIALCDIATARLNEADAAAAREAAAATITTAETFGFENNQAFAEAFDAGLVSWADDGALVWG